MVVPSLAERPQDATRLAGRLLRDSNAPRLTPLTGVSATAEDAIRSHNWPGNGRELRTRLLRAVEGRPSPAQPCDPVNVTLPEDLETLTRNGPEQAHALRIDLRQEMQAALASGHRIVDFNRSGRCYLLAT